jgi:dienelactone hydrolase
MRLARQSRPLLAALYAAVLGAFSNPASAEDAPPAQLGTLVPRVVCGGDAQQSYAIYLPPGYTRDRPWPIIYGFDPGARGLMAVKIFREAAERFGYIVVASNNARNGSWKIIEDAARAMVTDTHRRLNIDPRRRYTTGFSGGARAASVVAQAFKFTGVIACGAGLPEGGLSGKTDFVYFGAAGFEDFNYSEVQDATRAWAGRKLPQRFAVFDGGHAWFPPRVATEAVAWLELQAMRAGLRPRDDAFIRTVFDQQMQAAATRSEPGQAYHDYCAIADDFAGLVDTAEPTDRAAALKKTKPVRRFLSEEKRLYRLDARWREQLEIAIAEACNPAAKFGATEAIAPMGGNDAMGGSPAFAMAQGESGDRFALLRETASDIQREDADNPARRRALSRAFAWVHRARTAFDSGDVGSAMILFEAATILHPQAAEPYFAWARACALRNEKKLAQQLLQTALANGFDDRERLAQLQQTLAQ